jgi:hypothetical protein
MLLHMGASGLVNVIVEYAFDDDGYSPLEGVTDFLIGAATAPVGIAAPAKLLKHVGKAFGKFIGSRLMLKALTQFGSSFLESLADTAAFALKRKYVEQQPVTYGLLAEYFIGNLVFTAAFSQVPLGFRFATVQGKDELNALSRKDKGAWKRWLDNYTGVSSAELRDKREMLQNYVIPMLDNVNGFFTWQIRGVEMGDFILDFFINMSGEAHEANLDID